MATDVLFEIKKEHLETGLRGFPVGYCPTSDVDPIKGLSYAGIAIPELANWEPERVIYLLYTGRQAKPTEENEQGLATFIKDLQQRAPCLPETLTSIRRLPREGHPMKLFCAALLILGMLEGTNDYREDCLNLIAKIPEIAATVINHHAGWTVSVPSQPSLGYMENFTHLLHLPADKKAILGPIFKLFNVLHYDHGGGNLSTFVGKAVASSLEDLYGSIVSAMCALAGPLHGKANQEALEFVQQLVKDLGDEPTASQLETHLKHLLADKGLIYGFGHAVLRFEDPRATVLYEIANQQFAHSPLIKMANLLRQVGHQVLSENHKIADPYPNVDAISGSLLFAAGFPYPEYFTILFGLSRVVGIAIQIVYERCEARDGKGTPIVRPKYLYKPREFKEVD